MKLFKVILPTKSLFTNIWGVDPLESNIISFDADYSASQLSHQLVFQILVGCLEKYIFHTVIDEGEATCIMSLLSWKALDSPQISTSPTVLKAFDGNLFKPHGIITSLPIELGGKTISIEFEVVDSTFDYNLLFECSWFYVMKVVASSIYQSLREN